MDGLQLVLLEFILRNFMKKIVSFSCPKNVMIIQTYEKELCIFLFSK
jgi:hypothetical protein